MIIGPYSLEDWRTMSMLRFHINDLKTKDRTKYGLSLSLNTMKYNSLRNKASCM